MSVMFSPGDFVPGPPDTLARGAPKAPLRSRGSFAGRSLASTALETLRAQRCHFKTSEITARLAVIGFFREFAAGKPLTRGGSLMRRPALIVSGIAATAALVFALPALRAQQAPVAADAEYLRKAYDTYRSMMQSSPYKGVPWQYLGPT